MASTLLAISNPVNPQYAYFTNRDKPAILYGDDALECGTVMARREFICNQIPILEQQITDYQNAATALATNQIQSFTLDTGQTKETVTKLDMDKIQAVIDTLYNRYIALCSRCNGSNVIIARPCW